jgi:hypothetical protein
MIDKSLDELVENTTDRMEDFLRTHIPQNMYDLHEDIVILYMFLDKSQKPDYNPGEHELNQVMEAMGRCRDILEYGDRLIGLIKPIYNDPFSLFGGN